jgi:hypothetical protein
MASMTPIERAALLSAWIKPSSENEQVQQGRAERMVAEAISTHTAFDGYRDSIKVYAKGSYANNTNVRRDSDVDIVVENRHCCYFDYVGDFVHPTSAGTPYTGPWDPTTWRAEVEKALLTCFGNEVDASGGVAIVIPERAGSRPSIDVVPCFKYHAYFGADLSSVEVGTKVFKKSGGSVENWPKQQLDNGRAKNVRTGQRYKNYARALKNAENQLAKTGVIKALPSYFMECLAWNVPDSVLGQGTLDVGFRATLVWLWNNLGDNYVYENWLEPNLRKYLFWGGQKWTRDDAKVLVLSTWQMLDYT